MPLHVTGVVSRRALAHPEEKPLVSPVYERVLKYNPNHDKAGRFTHGSHAGSGTPMPSYGGSAGGKTQRVLDRGSIPASKPGENVHQYTDRVNDEYDQSMDPGFIRHEKPFTGDPGFTRDEKPFTGDPGFLRSADKPTSGYTGPERRKNKWQ